MCIDFDLTEHKFIKVYGRCPEKYLSETKRTYTFIPLKNVNIKNTHDDNFVKNHNYHPYSFESEIEVNEIPSYLELFSVVVKNWWNWKN